MEKTIIGVQYKDKKTGEYGGRAYSYFCTLPVVEGDIVLAPTANGDSLAQVSEVNMSESKIDERILPILKTITNFAEETGEQE